MRLFKVESEWGDDALTWEKCVHVTRRGGEEPALWVGECPVPVSTELATRFESAVPLVRLPLLVAELADTELLSPRPEEVHMVRANRYWGPALVHVKPTPYPGGKTRLRSSCFGERLVSGRFCSRVEREYLPLMDAEGIRIIAEDGNESLLELLPSSSFRVEYEPASVPAGASPVLLVSWSGKKLRAQPPRHLQR